MNQQHNVFSVFYSDILGQRLAMLLHQLVTSNFKELFASYHTTSDLKEKLARVKFWNVMSMDKDSHTTIVQDEHTILKKTFDDVDHILHKKFCQYVKHVKGSPSVRILLNVPSSLDFLHTFLINISLNTFMQEGTFFKQGPVDQLYVCTLCMDQTFHSFVHSKYVRLEAKPMHRKAPSQVASSIPPPISQTPSISEFPAIPEFPDFTNLQESNESLVRPEDSISNVGYRQQEAVQEQQVEKNSNSSIALSETSLTKHNQVHPKAPSDTSSVLRRIQEEARLTEQHEKTPSDISLEKPPSNTSHHYISKQETAENKIASAESEIASDSHRYCPSRLTHLTGMTE